MSEIQKVSPLKDAFTSMFDAAYSLNRQNILDLCCFDNHAKVIDLGCDDGAWTSRLGQQIGSTDLFGVEIVPERANMASKRGVSVVTHDLALDLPFEADSFDVVHANQVIEHVPYIDRFAAEIFRVLKPGGYAVISTENASSWHNVFSLIMGWQMFSLTNLSTMRLGLGNPLALHRGEKDHLGSWTHKTIFSYCGLIDFLEAHGFRSVKVKGAGYYPLPSWVGKLDPRHSHFITAICYK